MQKILFFVLGVFTTVSLLTTVYVLLYKDISTQTEIDDEYITLTENILKVEGKLIEGVWDYTNGELCEDNEPCIMDLKITDNDKSFYMEGWEHTRVQGIDKVKDELGVSTNYYILRTGSTASSSSYLLNDNGYISETLMTSKSSGEFILNDKYFVFNGVYYESILPEGLTGVQYLKIETGEIKDIAKPVSSYEVDGTEKYYTIQNSSFNSPDTLLISECTISLKDESSTSCVEKEIDLNEYMDMY